MSTISQDPAFIRGTFAALAPRYDLANHVLSGGLDFYWRRQVAKLVATWQPGRVLDLATGSGDLALALRQHCPRARIIGSDFCEPMLRQAQRKGLAPLVAADALALPFAEETFDTVTVAFGLRNMADWSGAWREMRRVLRPGGHALVLDFSLPTFAPLRKLYRPYLHHVLPAVAGWIAGDRSAYRYLAESIEAFPSGRAMRALCEGAGFQAPTARPMTGGIVSLYTGTK